MADYPVQERTLDVAGLLCDINYAPAPKVPLPAVILLHQRQGRKEDLAPMAKTLANAGFVAVRWDAANHGTRLVNQDDNKHWLQGNMSNGVHMYSQMCSTLREIQLVIDFLPCILSQQISDLEIKSWGVLGFSLGGHSALLAFTHEHRLQTCVSVISAGDYVLNLEKRYESMGELTKRKNLPPLPKFSFLFPPALHRAVERFDPICNVAALAEGCRPLLVMNGGADKLVSLECNQKLHKELAPIYEKSGKSFNLKHVIFDGVKHEVTDEMRQQSLRWLIEHLSPGIPASTL